MIKFPTKPGVILRRLNWLPDGRSLVAIAVNGHSYEAMFWNEEGDPIKSFYLGRDRGNVPVFGGTFLAIADNDRVYLKTLAGDDLYEVRPDNLHNANIVALGTDGTWLISILPWPDYEFQSTIQVHELHVLGAVPHCAFFASGRVHDAVVDSSRKFLLATSDTGFTIWDLKKKESVLAAPILGVRNGIWSPDAFRVYLRKAQQIECRTSFRNDLIWSQPLGAVNSATIQAVSPDGNIIATTDGELVRLFSSIDGHQIAAYDWQLGQIFALAFAPDGLTIAGGSRDGHIVIWDVE